MAFVDSTGRLIASTPLSEEQLVALMALEIRTTATTNGPAILMVEPSDLFHVVALLQLAGRHPGLEPSHHAAIAGFLGMAQEYFRDCPTVLATLRQGADPACDVAPGGGPCPASSC
jgi:hypothetical protein